MCDINMITTENMLNFKDSKIVLDGMGDQLNKNITCYFTEGRHYNIQMIVMCHKPAQIIITTKMRCHAIYITTYKGTDLFNNFDNIYNCELNFHDIISGLNGNYYNTTFGTAPKLRYGIINYNKKEDTFVINHKSRTMVYDSRLGFLDLKALRIKTNL